jgi:hypothetical protein
MPASSSSFIARVRGFALSMPTIIVTISQTYSSSSSSSSSKEEPWWICTLTNIQRIQPQLFEQRDVVL